MCMQVAELYKTRSPSHLPPSPSTSPCACRSPSSTRRDLPRISLHLPPPPHVHAGRRALQDAISLASPSISLHLPMCMQVAELYKTRSPSHLPPSPSTSPCACRSPSSTRRDLPRISLHLPPPPHVHAGRRALQDAISLASPSTSL